MRDEEKTKEQVIGELTELRRQLAEVKEQSEGTIVSLEQRVGRLAQQRIELQRSLGSIGHKLNNSLTAIVGNVSMAKLYLTEQRDSNAALQSLTKAEEVLPEAAEIVKELSRMAASVEPPAQKEPVESVEGAGREELLAPASIAGEKVLVMDDDDNLLKIVRLYLEKIGCEVVTVIEGAGAVELCKEAKAAGKPFDVVCLDLENEKGMGGLETIQKLRDIDPTVKAIIWAGRSAHPVLADPAKYGFLAGLEKPISLFQLTAVLGQITG